MLIGEDSTSKRKVGIYIRVSTQEQNIDGFSLEAQRKRLVEYVESNQGLNLTTKKEWIFEDTHTGSDLNRTELNRLRACVKRGDFDAVLVWKIDRLSRSLKHLLVLFEEFEMNEVSFVSVQENIDFKGPIGKLIFQIFGAIAQFERELIRGRTWMGKVTSAEMGNFVGSAVPYGYKPIQNKSGKGKKIHVLPDEKKWVQKMFEWYVYDEMGFGQIATKLTELKVPKGKYSKARNKFSKWDSEMIGRIIKNPLYRGEYIANKKDGNNCELPPEDWTIVSVQPCVSEFLFQQAQNVLSKRKGGWGKHTYMLSGKLRDKSAPGYKAFVGCQRSKGGFSYRRKKFQDEDGIDYSNFEFPGKQLDEYVIKKIQDALKEPKVFINKYLSQKYTSKTRVQKIEDQLDVLRVEKINVEMSLEKVEMAYERGHYSEDKLAEKSTKIQNEITDIDQKIKDLEEEIVLISSVDVEVKKLKDASKQINYKLEKLSIKQKRTLVDLFIDRIEMNRVKVDNKRKVTADIFFRFNPSKVKSDINMVRTRKLDDKAKKPKENSGKRVTGATNGN